MAIYLFIPVLPVLDVEAKKPTVKTFSEGRPNLHDIEKE